MMNKSRIGYFLAGLLIVVVCYYRKFPSVYNVASTPQTTYSVHVETATAHADRHMERSLHHNATCIVSKQQVPAPRKRGTSASLYPQRAAGCDVDSGESALQSHFHFVKLAEKRGIPPEKQQPATGTCRDAPTNSSLATRRPPGRHHAAVQRVTERVFLTRLVPAEYSDVVEHGYWLLTDDLEQAGDARELAVQALGEDVAVQYGAKCLVDSNTCRSIKDTSPIDDYICEAIQRKHLHPFSYTLIGGGKKEFTCHKEYTLEEYQEQRLTRGGSSFLVEMRMRATGLILLCSTHDQYNGTYSVLCPCVNGVYNVTVVQLFHDFLALATPYTQYLIPAGTETVLHITDSNTQCPPGASPPGWARQGDGSWRWLEAGGRPGKMWLFSQQERQCLQRRVKSLHLYGDSHMRSVYFYLQYALYGRVDWAGFIDPEHRDSETGRRKLNFHWSVYVEEMGRALSSANHTRDDVVMFMVGSWDLGFRTLESFIQDSQTLVDYVKRTPGGNVGKPKLIWMKNVAFPSKLVYVRNTVLTEAANAHLQGQFAEAKDVVIIDGYSITAPRAEETVYKTHYFQPLDMTDYFVGSVGYVYVNELLKAICGFG